MSVLRAKAVTNCDKNVKLATCFWYQLLIKRFKRNTPEKSCNWSLQHVFINFYITRTQNYNIPLDRKLKSPKWHHQNFGKIKGVHVTCSTPWLYDNSLAWNLGFMICQKSEHLKSDILDIRQQLCSSINCWYLWIWKKVGQQIYSY